MNDFDNGAKTIRPWLLVGLLGLLFQFGVALYFRLNFDPAIVRLMPDDAFYYFKIAQNIAHGYGSVFSEGEPTNGYHPLWMLILVPLGYLDLQPANFIFAALLLAAVLNLGAAALLVKLLRELGCELYPVALALVILLFSPWFVNLTFTGLETPLLFCCLLWFFITSVRVWRSPDGPVRDWIFFGISGGFLMLTRTDMIFFTAPFFLFALLKFGRRVFLRLVLTGVVSSLLLAPWCLWNYFTFGSLLQSSADAMPLLMHAGYADSSEAVMAPPYTAAKILHFLVYKQLAVAYKLLFSLFVPSATPGPKLLHNVLPALMAVAMLLAAGGIWILVRHFQAIRRRFSSIPFAAWAASAIALDFFYLYIRWFWQRWHMAPLLLIGLIGIAMLVPGRLLKAGRLVLLTVLLFALCVYSLGICYYYPQTANIRSISDIVSWQSEAATRLHIGMTDAGYSAFFSRHKIVNLDGVVNNNAAKAIKAGRLSDYIRSQNFDRVYIEEARLPIYDRNIAPADRVVPSTDGGPEKHP